MKNITITVPPEYTGNKNNTNPWQNPIAKGLINSGYIHPVIDGCFWRAKRYWIIDLYFWKFYITKKCKGTIPFETNMKSLEISIKKQTEQTTLTLNLQ